MKNYSKIIDDFLCFLREAEQDYKIANQEEQDANGETQDILHELELLDHKYHEFAQLSKELKEIRIKRREAKNVIESTGPIISWLENNRQTVKNLEQLLGTVRKAQRSVENNKIYTPRVRKNQ